MFRSVTRAPRLNVGRIMKQWPVWFHLYSSSWFRNPDCLHLGLALQWPSLLRNFIELTAAMRSFFWQIYFCACRVHSSRGRSSPFCEANKRKLPPHASWVCDFEPWNRRVEGVRRDQQGLDKQCFAGIDSLLTVMFNSCGTEPCHNMNRLAREKFDTTAATFLRRLEFSWSGGNRIVDSFFAIITAGRQRTKRPACRASCQSSLVHSMLEPVGCMFSV